MTGQITREEFQKVMNFPMTKYPLWWLCISLASVGMVYLFSYSDMLYQRDVALVTADWCWRDPESSRCNQVMRGEWPVLHYWTYIFSKHD